MAHPRSRRSARPTTVSELRVAAYRRVSTVGQVESGAGLDAQAIAIEQRIGREGWTTVEWVADEGISAKDMKNRPALRDVLERLDAAELDVLVCSKLDRLSRSVRDFAEIMERARQNGWRLVLLDVDIDTSTASGEFVANVVANASQFERRLISGRTIDALAARRAAGVRLGRPPVLPQDVVQRIVGERAQGVSIGKIAAGLAADGIPTARGGAWSRGSVQSVLAGQDAAKLAAAAV